MGTLKRVALIGRDPHTLPTYRSVISRLCADFQIVVYCEVPLRSDGAMPYIIRSPGRLTGFRRFDQFLVLFLLIADHVFRRSFDLVHAHSTFPNGFCGLIFKYIFRVPVIVSLDGAEASMVPDIRFGDLQSSRRIRLNTWVVKNADVVTCLTQFQLADARKYLQAGSNTVVIPRGVDVDLFRFRRSFTPGRPIVFINVAYLSPVKDPVTLMRTFKILQREIDCLLLHVGNDYMAGTVQELASEIGIADKVRFCGHVGYEAMAGLYSNADVFLQTSRFESQGMAAVEAMASGLIVCGTNVGLLSDLSGECCVTVPPREPESLAAAVLTLLNDEPEIERIRRNARLWCEKHDLVSSTAALRNIYRNLTSHDADIIPERRHNVPLSRR